jgi:flagellar hook-associated protein 2
MTTTSSATSTPAVITSTAPTTSTASTAASAVTTNSIDVASIVAQLMTVENKPLDALTSKIGSTQTLISDLGTMKSRVAALQTSLTTFEDPSTYNNPTTNSSNSSVVTATATSNAAIGSVNVTVSQLAAASSLILHASNSAGPQYTDFSSATATTGVDSNNNALTLQLGSGIIYSTKTTPISGTGANGAVTLNDLQNWINSLGINVSAKIVKTTGSSSWVLQVNGTQTGSANAVTIGGAGTGNPGANLESVATAQDAKAVIGGLSVTRSSNSISDVVQGITFNLTGISANPASITVSQGADTSSAMINTLITAYNNVITQYNAMTANSTNSSTPGNFANDPTMLSFVNNIKSMFAYGATDASTTSITGFSSSSYNVNIDSVNGYLQVGTSQYKFKDMGVASPTVSQFVTWMNGLGSGVLASFDGININISNANSNAHLSVNLSGVTSTVKRNTTSLAGMGMDLQLDGTIQFNTANYQTAVANNLYGKLSQGLKMGYSNALSNLDTFLTSELDATNGALTNQITAEQSSVTRMQKQQTNLQARLTGIQQSYVTQYSALNALLFQLNSTSTSLASSLAAVTNINAGK